MNAALAYGWARNVWPWLRRASFPGRPAEAAPAATSFRLRSAIVPDGLADLRGPSSGTVELPVRLHWSLPDHVFDLADRDDALDMYEAVIGGATSVDDITRYLNGGLLADLWPELGVERAKRRAWEESYPALRAAAASPAVAGSVTAPAA